MNQITAYSAGWYKEARQQVSAELADELFELEKSIRANVTREFSIQLEQASWWHKFWLKRRSASVANQRIREAVESLLAQKGVPEASAESLY